MRVILEGGPYDGLVEEHEHLPSRLAYPLPVQVDRVTGKPVTQRPDDNVGYIRMGLIASGRHVYRYEPLAREDDMELDDELDEA